MKPRHFQLIIIVAVVFFALFIFGISLSCSPSYAQGSRNREEGGPMRRRTGQEDPREKYRQLLQEAKSKGYDVSEAQALGERAKRAIEQRNRPEAQRLLGEAIAKLELLKSRDSKPQEDNKASEKFSAKEMKIPINIGADKVRVIDTFPLDVVNVSDNTLKNFRASEQSSKEGKVVLNINFPVLVEEYPYSDFSLKNNKAFGATESGLVKMRREVQRRGPPRASSVSDQDSDLQRIFKIMSQAGLGLARDFQSYDTRRVEIEARKGEYDYSRSDFAVDACRAGGFDFLGRLGLHYGKMGQEGPPSDEAAYVAYIRNTVSRYADKVKVWQVLKEPSPQKRGRMGNDAGLSPKDVVRVLELSYNTIKSVNPNATVYFPGLGAPMKRGGKYTDESYLSEIISLGGGKYFDAIGFDAYVFHIEEQVQTYTKILKRYGCDKPLWVAQTGVPAGKIEQPIPFKGGGSDRTQIEFMVKAYATAFALGVEKVFWGEFLDKSKSEEKGRSTYSDTWNQTGLFYTGTWEKKPGYFTHRLLATALDNFTGATQLTPNTVKFTFSNRSPIYLVWPTTVPLRFE